MRIAVTGAAGRLGGQVVRLLVQQGTHDVVGLCRRPAALPPGVAARIADYASPGALRASLTEVDTLVLVSSDGEGTRVLTHHQNLVAAARDRGFGHILALSGVDAVVDSPFCYAITNGVTEQLIRDSGCEFSIVRASFFAEFFSHFLLPSRTSGLVRLPMADAAVGLVSRIDVGRCLAILARSAPTGRVHDVTAPPRWTARPSRRLPAGCATGR